MFYDDEYKAGYWQGANDASRGFKPMPQPTWSSGYRDGYADGYYETNMGLEANAA